MNYKNLKDFVYKNQNILWILYFSAAGVMSYFIFKTNFLYILLFIIAAETTFYLVFNKQWDFVKRYLFNIFYVMGYVVPLLIEG